MTVVLSIPVADVLYLAGVIGDGWPGVVPFVVSVAALISYLAWIGRAANRRTMAVDVDALTVSSKRDVQRMSWCDISAIETPKATGVVIERGDGEIQLVIRDVERANLAVYAKSGEIDPRRVVMALHRRASSLPDALGRR